MDPTRPPRSPLPSSGPRGRSVDRRTALKWAVMKLAGVGLARLNLGGLKLGGGMLAGLGVGACAPRATGPVAVLPPIQVGWGRVIGTLVGLRPYRPSGTRIEAEGVDGRVVVHNYGHGGAGVSLSLGSAVRAAELAGAALGDIEANEVAVIGAGAVGLATARELQRRGFAVTVYTRAVWPDPEVCSGVAPARFTPGYSIIDSDRRTATFDAMYTELAETSYRRLHQLAGGGYGVSWRYDYRLTNSVGSALREPVDGIPDPLTGVSESVILEPGRHPFSTRYAVRSVTLTVDTPVFLEALMRDFLAWGGRLVIRTIQGPADLLSLSEPVVVNCSGLGARKVWDDDEVVPLRGQLTVVVPQPGVDFIVTGSGVSLVPRGSGLLLGGAPNRRDDWSMEPDLEAARTVVERHVERLSGMVEHGPSRPPVAARGVRLEEARPPGAPARAPLFDPDDLVSDGDAR